MEENRLLRLAQVLQCPLDQVAHKLQKLVSWSDQVCLLAISVMNRLVLHYAFKELYRRYWERVRAHVLRNSGNLDQAKDLLQDSLLKLHMRAQREALDLEKTNLEAYFTTIYKNTWISQQQKAKKMLTVPLEDQKELERLPEENSFWEEEEVRLQQSRYLKASMAKLTPMQRQILNWLYFDELKPAEIYERLKGEHSSRQVTYNAILAAKQALKKIIESDPVKAGSLT